MHLVGIYIVECLFESSTCFEQICAHPQEDNCINTTSGWGHAVAQLVEALRFPMVSLDFFIDVILPAAIWPWG